MVEQYAAGEDQEDPGSFVSLNWLLTEEPLDVETELVRPVLNTLRKPLAAPQCAPWRAMLLCVDCAWGASSNSSRVSILYAHAPRLQALGFLNYLMLGTSASPLRKALNDSGLGESVIGGGVDDDLRQPVFSIGLKASGVAQLAQMRWCLLAAFLFRSCCLLRALRVCATACCWASSGRPATQRLRTSAPPPCIHKPRTLEHILKPCPRWLQGVKPEDTGKVEELVMSELQRLAAEGFTQSSIEAAINTIEFSLR